MYDSIAAVNQALRPETGSRVADVRFADWTTLDLRVPAAIVARAAADVATTSGRWHHSPVVLPPARELF